MRTGTPASASDLPPAIPDDLEGSPRLLRSILNEASDGFTALDRNWHVTYMNTAAARLLDRLGKTPEDFVDRSLWEALPEAVETRFYSEYQRAMRDNVHVEFEEYYPPLDAWFQVRLFPSADGLLAYTHEVTEAKRAEAVLAERTRSLALSADVGRALTSGESLSRDAAGLRRGHRSPFRRRLRARLDIERRRRTSSN